jgi:alkyldihydroxyacetonephosphate synthase
MAIDHRRLRWNGWGLADQPDPLRGKPGVWEFLANSLGVAELRHRPPVPLEEAQLSTPLREPMLDELRGIVGAEHVRADRLDRAGRARGKSYPDLLALRAGDLSAAPGAVVLPGSADEVLALLRFAGKAGLAVIPFGGGSSVVGGVTGPSNRAAFTVDVTRLDRLLDFSPVDRTATLEAGIDGPALEAALARSGFMLGHAPQSFLHSTLGGWIAARGAGQQSNRYGRAEDWLVGAELATPTGLWRTEPFPGSAAGPRLGDLVPGSEGTLGIITAATVRIQPLPQVRDHRAYLMPHFAAGREAIRAIVQQGLAVATLRLSDAAETAFLGAFSELGKSRSLGQTLAASWLRARGIAEERCLLIAGYEGGRAAVASLRRAAEHHVRNHRGVAVGRGPGERWYRSRFDGPHLRDPLSDRGVGVDTLETAARWSKLEGLYYGVRQALERSIAAQAPVGGRGVVMAHISHSYSDGASLYFTFLFPQRPGEEIAQWRAIKTAATDAIVACGGTISHHHGVGTDHLPWMSAEKGEVALSLLRAVKATVDPAGIMNPGKLIP